MHTEQSVWIVIPIYNEGPIITEVIKEVQKNAYFNIIIVDDGSQDNTYQEIGTRKDIVYIKHLINRGKGAAIKTGVEAAKNLKADIVITLDGDGQHNPSDITKMLQYIRQGYDIVLGSRLKGTYRLMPFYKKIYNHVGNLLVWFLYGLYVTDSQSGFRAYSQRALESIDTRTDRYTYDSEVIKEINRLRLKFIEVPIETRYTEYSMNKLYKMNLKNGVKTLIKMILS